MNSVPEVDWLGQHLAIGCSTSVTRDQGEVKDFCVSRLGPAYAGYISDRVMTASAPPFAVVIETAVYRTLENILP